MNPKGNSNLQALICSMEPILHDGEYIFTTVKNADNIPRTATICEFKEAEGVTLILSMENALLYKLPLDYVASWITLNVHSSLEAVGLTAAFAAELGNNNISCNVVAGYYHDHIFVAVMDGKKALEVLKNMTKKG